MSIVKNINKDVNSNSGKKSIAQHIYYPNGYKEYAIFISIISISVLIVCIYGLIKNRSLYENYGFINCLPLTISFTSFILMSFYELIVSWKLSTRRITLTVSDGKIIFKGAITTKIINISDIEKIERNDIKLVFEVIIIKAKKNREKGSNSQIVIPLIWFGTDSLISFVKIIKKQKLNKKLKIDFESLFMISDRL